MTELQSEETEYDVRSDLMRKIRMEGVVVAYETALGICRDPKAPAPAKATALSALFRVGGYFEKVDTVAEKGLHEMDHSELMAATAKAIRRLEAFNETWGDAAEPADNASADGYVGDVFG